MGSMSIFMDMRDELSLRKLLNDNILDSPKMIADTVPTWVIGSMQFFEQKGSRMVIKVSSVIERRVLRML